MSKLIELNELKINDRLSIKKDPHCWVLLEKKENGKTKNSLFLPSFESAVKEALKCVPCKETLKEMLAEMKSLKNDIVTALDRKGLNEKNNKVRNAL